MWEFKAEDCYLFPTQESKFLFMTCIIQLCLVFQGLDLVSRWQKSQKYVIGIKFYKILAKNKHPGMFSWSSSRRRTIGCYTFCQLQILSLAKEAVSIQKCWVSIEINFEAMDDPGWCHVVKAGNSCWVFQGLQGIAHWQFHSELEYTCICDLLLVWNVFSFWLVSHP